MSTERDSLDYDFLRNQGTGGHQDLTGCRVIDYAFDKYIVKILVTPANEFVGIVEIQINTDFRSFQQKMATIGYHDVDDFYKEDE